MHPEGKASNSSPTTDGKASDVSSAHLAEPLGLDTVGGSAANIQSFPPTGVVEAKPIEQVRGGSGAGSA